MVELCGWLDSFSFHMFRRASEGVVSSGAVQVRKLLCDFSRLGAGTWPCRGCLSSVACLRHSTLLATALLMSGGAIPARMVDGVSGLQAPSDVSAALVKSRVQFFCMGASLPHWAGIFCSREAEDKGCGT